MKLLMIAVIQQDKKILGYRIFDAEAKEGKKVMNVPEYNMKEVLSSGKAQVNNLGLANNELVGTNGSLERYTKVAPNGQLIGNKAPLVIINQIGEVGYTVVDYLGRVKKARINDVVHYAKLNGIANGKVVMKDNVEFISSISGSYEVEKVAQSKVKDNNDDVKIHISLNQHQGSTKTIANHADVDVEVEIEENDVFEAMTDSQRMVIKDYYIWYTVDKYKSFANNIRLDINLAKAEILSELRGITEWEFGGIWDSGYMGGDKCKLNHSLRYVYYAVPKDDRDNPDARIKFGETCSSDFFNISKEDMRSLVKTRKIMSDEIRLLADILANEQERLYMGKAALLYSVIKRLGTVENIVDIFGEKVGNTLISFITTKLPFPMSLVLEASKQVSKDKLKFYSKLFPGHEATFSRLLADKTSKQRLVYGGYRYLDFIATNKIEGEYAYNPLDDTITRREVGAYNKNTRYERQKLISIIEGMALCREYTLDEIEDLIYCVETLDKYRELINNELKSMELFKEDRERIIGKAEEFADVSGLDIETKNKRLVIYNTLVGEGNYSSYGSNFVKYRNDRSYAVRHRYIKELRESLENVDFNNVLSEFKDILMEEEKEYAKNVEEKLKEIEREMEEQAKRDREIEEAKSKEVAEDITTKLRGLIESNPSIPVTQGVEIAKNILDTGKLYAELTMKQRWRIDKTLSYYEDIIEKDKNLSENNKKDKDEYNSNKKDKDEYNNSSSNNVEVDNKSYNLDEYKDIKDKVDRLLASKDTKEMKKVLKSEPFVLKIAYTVNKYNRASDKQLKHINKAIEILDQS